MDLYVCAAGTLAKGVPVLGDMHYCARAAHALDAAGLDYTVKKARGAKGLVWTLPSRHEDRAEVRALSGQDDVPILVLDDDQVITGTNAIVSWARQHAAA